MRRPPPLAPIPGWEANHADDWAGWLGVPRLHLLSTVGSTNQYLRSLASEGHAGKASRLRPFTTVVALGQSDGRGRNGKLWHSPSGSGLWMSILLPMPDGGPPGVAPLAVGISLALALESVLRRELANASATSASPAPHDRPLARSAGALGKGVRMGLKWPNDIVVEGLAEDRPRQWSKLGGILCEVAPGGIVAGVGVNLKDEGLPLARELQAEKEPAVRGPRALAASHPIGQPLDAISLQRVVRNLGPDGAEPVVAASTLARAVILSLRQWADPPPSRLEGQLREAWESLDLLRGREVEVRPGPRGRANGVSDDGALLVGSHAIRAGSVRCADLGIRTPQPTTTEQESE